MPTAADMTLPGRWYLGGPAKINNPHISQCTVYILRSQVQVQSDIYVVFGLLVIYMDKRKSVNR